MTNIVESSRDKVNGYEAVLNNASNINFVKSYHELGLRIKHYFSDGIYARELFIPKGIILTGHIHKYENLNILSQGVLEVLVDDKIKLLKAPATIVSPPGIKRIARVLEDVIWTTIHRTDSIDLEEIEHEFVAHSEEEYLEFVNKEPFLPFEGMKCLT